MGASSLDSSMMQASLGQSQGRQLELQNRVRGLNESSSSRLTPEQKEKRLREACEGFESIFIQKMWQQMRATLPQNGLLHSRDEKMWQDMYDQELAKSMASVGGIGLADMMYEQLSRNLVSASRGTAGAGGRSAVFVAEAAPLVTPAAATPAETGKSPVAVADASAEAPQASPIYEGYAPVSGVVDQAAAPAAAQPQAASDQGLSHLHIVEDRRMGKYMAAVTYLHEFINIGIRAYFYIVSDLCVRMYCCKWMDLVHNL